MLYFSIWFRLRVSSFVSTEEWRFKIPFHCLLTIYFSKYFCMNQCPTKQYQTKIGNRRNWQTYLHRPRGTFAQHLQMQYSLQQQWLK